MPDSNRPGLIYILRATAGPLCRPGVYKIGRTINLERRLAKLRDKYGCRMEVVHTFTTDDMGDTECSLRIAYYDQSIDQEWFELDDEALALLKAFEHVPRYPTWGDLLRTMRETLKRPAVMRPPVSEAEIERKALRERWLATRASVKAYRQQLHRNRKKLHQSPTTLTSAASEAASE